MITGKIKKKVKKNIIKSRSDKRKGEVLPATGIRERKASKPLLQGLHLSPLNKLKVLILKEPTNEMYLSFQKCFNKVSPLSGKQLNIIINDFERKILNKG